MSPASKNKWMQSPRKLSKTISVVTMALVSALVAELLPPILSLFVARLNDRGSMHNTSPILNGPQPELHPEYSFSLVIGDRGSFAERIARSKMLNQQQPARGIGDDRRQSWKRLWLA